MAASGCQPAQESSSSSASQASYAEDATTRRNNMILKGETLMVKTKELHRHYFDHAIQMVESRCKPKCEGILPPNQRRYSGYLKTMNEKLESLRRHQNQLYSEFKKLDGEEGPEEAEDRSVEDELREHDKQVNNLVNLMVYHPHEHLDQISEDDIRFKPEIRLAAVSALQATQRKVQNLPIAIQRKREDRE